MTMKNKTLVQCVMLALVCVSGLLHISSASSSSVLATTAEPTTAATKAGTVEAATATSTKLSTEHMLYRTTDRTCELAIADLNGQNAICVARNLVSDMVAAAQKAWAIDPQDKTVKTSTHLDADLFADGSKVIVRTRAYFDRGDSASLINVFRYYLVDLAAGSSKVFVDGTDTKTRLPIQADVRIATDGMRVAYTDRTSLFIDALDGNPPRQVAEDGLFLHFAAIAWSPDGIHILFAEYNSLLMYDSNLYKGIPVTLHNVL